MSFQVSRLVFGPASVVFALACSAAPENEPLPSDLGVSEQALRSQAFLASSSGTFSPVAVGPLFIERHTCSGNYCDCTGDPECNDMFSGSDCATGPGTAVCQIRDEVPKCRCTRAAKAE